MRLRSSLLHSVFVPVIFIEIPVVAGFARPVSCSLFHQTAPPLTESRMSNFFDSISDFFGNDGAKDDDNDNDDDNNEEERSRNKEKNVNLNESSTNDNNNKDSESPSLYDDYDVDNNDEFDEEDVGVSPVLNLPFEYLKPGALRLYLFLHLMGVQNTPDKGTWSVDQPTADEYAIDLFYHDRTAILMIRLTEDELTIDRMGSTPSTTYIMQEAIIVDGILEELQKMMCDSTVKEEDRLMKPKEGNTIADLREKLAFQ